MPRPTPDEVAAFYQVDGYYTHVRPDEKRAPTIVDRIFTKLGYLADHGTEPTAPFWRSLVQPGNRVLEIGCGDGRHLKILRDAEAECVGVEPDPDARAQCGDLDVHDGAAEEIPNTVSGPFDLVIFSHVLEHTLDHRKALSNALALMRPGAKIVVEVPNNECRGVDFFGAAWRWLDIPRHVNFFTGDSLRDEIARAGFSVEEIQYRGYMRQLMPEWFAAQAEICRLIGSRIGRRRWHYALYYLLTGAARPGRKYDSVRVIAAKPL